MKSRILAMLVAMVISFAAVPAFAEEAPASESMTDAQDAVVEEITEPETTEVMPAEVTPAEVNIVPVGAPLDSQVQACIDEYEAIKAVLAQPSLTYADVMTIKTHYNVIIGTAFTDEQQEQFEEYVETTYGEQYFYDMRDCAYIIYVCETASVEYNTNHNIKTAYDLINAYDEISTERQQKINDVQVPGTGGITVRAFYYHALAIDYPHDIINVYEAYLDLDDALLFADMTELYTAAAAFEALLDTFNNFTDAELDQLALLMDETDGDDAYDIVLGTWYISNKILQMNDLYTAYVNDPEDKEKAAAFIEYYDALFADLAYDNDDFKMIFMSFFPDIEEDYADGYALLNSQDKNNKSGNPDTGDNMNVAGLAAVMLVSAVTAAFVLRRKTA